MPELDLDRSYDDQPDTDALEETVSNIEDRGITVTVVDSAEKALDTVTDLIPSDVSVMNGHSTTLEEIGFVDYLADGDHDWENLHEQVFQKEGEERTTARRKAQTADYFLGGVNAIARSGELATAGKTGSRVGAYPYAAQHVVLVSGTNKIMDSLEQARERIREYAYPLENARAQEAYGVGSAIGKEVIIHEEADEDRIHLVLITETLGY